MQKSSLYLSIGILLAVFTGIYSCTKVNGIDNNKIIETPYSLYFGDTSGAVYNSNDGKTYTTVFQADGYPCKAICTSYSNIILVKNNLYVSTNNGINFNIGYDAITIDTSRDCNNYPIGLNQSMILNVPDWYRLYLASDSFNTQNPLGMAVTTGGGVAGYWGFDKSYDTSGYAEGTAGGYGTLPATMISFTRLKNGVVCALGLNGSAPAAFSSPYTYKNYYRGVTLHNHYWEETTAGVFGAPRNMTGSPLPSLGFFTLGHYNNRLIAIDSKCTYGAYYSDDTGRTWIAYSGIPANTSLISIASPFEETCLIGSSNGLYILNLNTGSFQQVTNGLTSGLIVRSIAFKENIYKSGNTQKYVFLATNKGIYQSMDGGSTWLRTIPGNFTAIY